jgi:hypothetical protein
LGEGFLIDIVHNEVEAQGDKPKRTFANMKDADGNFLIGAPMYQTDPLDDTTLQPIPVPAPTSPIKLLLWNAPSTEQWASIFVDGTRTVKNEKGEEREVSKNWLQEDIVQNAVNFEGSPLQSLLGGVADLNLDLNPEQPSAPAGEPVAPEAPAAPAETEKAPETSSPAADAADADVMAALGL